MDKNYKMTFRMDTYVQGVLILMTLLCGFISLFGGIEFLIIGLALLFPLGVWQVSSGILFSILLKDKKRLMYLFSVVGFFTAMAIPTFFDLDMYTESASYFALSLMAVLAFYYFSITMRDMVATNTDYIRSRR